MCNSLSGQAALINGVVTLVDFRSTDRHCADKQLNQLDVQISQLLQQGATVTLTQQVDTLWLTLQNADHTISLLGQDLL